MKDLQVVAAARLCVALFFIAARAAVAAEPSTADPPERPITAGERDHWAYRRLRPSSRPASTTRVGAPTRSIGF